MFSITKTYVYLYIYVIYVKIHLFGASSLHYLLNGISIKGSRAT